ncbi:MAG TPA: MBL fold metallo-hydrolase [Chitinophagales bacterium]|jgi:hydroxyacylglutathione hydrolase|nr:MBL fold metallo-hydrolase [Chitinophagales bacterium]MBP6153898.1 MBL fold metallo-hydrolase [Chitinophagales bacterium]HQV78726.1 MBL fold metallo-hydrolase [Chitinophagales bacterium]HQW79092.1 MBL fold metallo-hydrolase [Chitinophagales bacterium]HRB68139.1 MBL fold metallo-hydrolase [Chitinophagales bacterium]
MDNATIKTDIAVFCFNPFQENTYIIAHPNKECWIIDPGCYTLQEQKILIHHIEKNELKPTKLINTHCHLDHIYGNKFIADEFQVELGIHEKELPILERAAIGARMFGAKIPEACAPSYFLDEKDIITLGEINFKILFTPGHSPGSICFYNETENYAIVGDVLFQGSIGRTDLPGGDYDTLLKSIKTKLMTLPDNTIIYNGHGISTSIGDERKHNPFLR